MATNVKKVAVTSQVMQTQQTNFLLPILVVIRNWKIALFVPFFFWKCFWYSALAYLGSCVQDSLSSGKLFFTFTTFGCISHRFYFLKQLYVLFCSDKRGPMKKPQHQPNLATNG